MRGSEASFRIQAVLDAHKTKGISPYHPGNDWPPAVPEFSQQNPALNASIRASPLTHPPNKATQQANPRRPSLPIPNQTTNHDAPPPRQQGRRTGDAARKLVLFGRRLVLAHNEVLYPLHKWFWRVLEDPSEENVEVFYQLWKGFRE
jgi:hypothetical protein